MRRERKEERLKEEEEEEDIYQGEKDENYAWNVGEQTVKEEAKDEVQSNNKCKNEEVRSFCAVLRQEYTHSVCQSVSQSVSQSINQSVNQSVSCLFIYLFIYVFN